MYNFSLNNYFPLNEILIQILIHYEIIFSKHLLFYLL